MEPQRTNWTVSQVSYVSMYGVTLMTAELSCSCTILKRFPHYIRHTLGFEYFKLVTWRRCKPSKLEELRFLPISDNEVLRLLRELSRELRKSRRLSGGGISGQSHLLLTIVAYTDLRLEEITNIWKTYVKRFQRKVQPFDGS